MDCITSTPTVLRAWPGKTPAPDEPGTLCEQFLSVLDWLFQPDERRRDPDEWEQSRRRWIPHAKKGAS